MAIIFISYTSEWRLGPNFSYHDFKFGTYVVHFGVFPSHFDYLHISLLGWRAGRVAVTKLEAATREGAANTFLLRQPAQVDLRCFDLGFVSTSAGMLKGVVHGGEWAR